MARKWKAPSWDCHDYIAWFIGETASDLGSGIAAIAWTMLVYQVTGSFTAAGTVAAVRTVAPMVSALYGGVLTDTKDRRYLLMADAFFEIATFGIIGVLAWKGSLTTPVLLLVAAVQGLAAGAFGPVRHALLPTLVPRSFLSKAVAANGVRDASLTLAGSPLGGILFGISPAIPFLANTVLSAVELVTTLSIRRSLRCESAENSGGGAMSLASMTYGFRWLRRSRPATAMILIGLVANAALMLLTLGGNLHLQSLHVPAWQIGVFDAAAGIGLLLGNMVAGAASSRLSPRWMVVAPLSIFCLLSLSLVWLDGVVAMTAVFFLLVCTVPCVPVATQPYLMALIDDTNRGKIMSAFLIVSMTAAGLTQVLGGLAMTGLGWQPVVVLAAALIGLAALLAALSPVVAAIPDQDHREEVEAFCLEPA